MTAYGVERPILHVNLKITQQGGLIGDVVHQVLCCRIELPMQGSGRRQKIRVPAKLVVQFHLALNELQTSNSYLGKQRRVRLKNEYPVCCDAVRGGLPKRPGYVGANFRCNGIRKTQHVQTYGTRSESVALLHQDSANLMPSLVKELQEDELALGGHLKLVQLLLFGRLEARGLVPPEDSDRNCEECY